MQMIIIIEPIVGTREYEEYHMGKWKDLAMESINRGLKRDWIRSHSSCRGDKVMTRFSPFSSDSPPPEPYSPIPCLHCTRSPSLRNHKAVALMFQATTMMCLRLHGKGVRQ